MIFFKDQDNKLVKMTTDSVEDNRKFVANRTKALAELTKMGYKPKGAILSLVKH